MKLLNHVQIKVEDLHKSLSFYELIMPILGYKKVLELQDKVVGFGTTPHDMFELRQASKESPISQSVHLAFNAATRRIVDEFYTTAINCGAKCNGVPGLRAEY